MNLEWGKGIAKIATKKRHLFSIWLDLLLSKAMQVAYCAQVYLEILFEATIGASPGVGMKPSLSVRQSRIAVAG